MTKPHAEIKPPPNGTMEYVRGSLSSLAGGSQPSDWENYYGVEGAKQLGEGFTEIADLLEQLNAAGVGSGREVTVRFKA